MESLIGVDLEQLPDPTAARVARVLCLLLALVALGLLGLS